MLLIYFVAAGVLVGLLGRGRLERLVGVSFRWAPLAVGGLLFQVLLFSAPVATAVGAWGAPLYVVSTLVVLVALLRNQRLPGFKVIAVGATLNLVAILTNGGLMPASPEALDAIRGVVAAGATFTNSVVAGAEAPFVLLGDIFVLPRPIPFANVFSIGDVIIGLGAVLFIVRVMRGAPVPQADRGPSDDDRAVTVSSGIRPAAMTGAGGAVPQQVRTSGVGVSLILGAEARVDG